MPSEGSITACLKHLKAGNREAAQVLWERYFHRLVGLARAKLRGLPAGRDAAEDVALSAFDSVYRRAERGQYERLDDRDNLWSLLFVVTYRKAIDHARREGRRPDGPGRLATLADMDEASVDEVLGPDPTPAVAAEIADECRRLFDVLEDPTLRHVALWKMEGFTNKEIAGRLGVIEQTVERKLRRIRDRWSEEVPS